MKVDTWMPLYVGDYLKDTRRLLTVQHGAYLLLLFDYWVNGGPPPDDDAVLAQVAGLQLKDWQRTHRKVLEPFFRIADGKWFHDRVETELRLAVEKRTKSEERARSAAEARYGKQRSEDASSTAPSIAPSIPGAGHKQSPEHAPSPSPTPPSLRSGGGRGTRLDRDWELPEAWKAWALAEQPTWDEAHATKVALNFRDYWTTKPGKDATKLDWERTWQTWVRKDGPKPTPRAGQAPAPTKAWRAGGEPDEVLNAAARKLQIDTWRKGETHGMFRARIVETPGGEELLRPARASA